MLFSDGKGKPNREPKKEDTTVHGFFMLQSDIVPNTEPIHFEMGKPKYANKEIDYKIIDKKKNGRIKDSKPEQLF